MKVGVTLHIDNFVDLYLIADGLQAVKWFGMKAVYVSSIRQEM